MLAHTFEGNQVAFYEIAATLIPILLLGGVVTERMRPKDDDSHDRVSTFALFIPALGATAVVAEVTAISAVVTGHGYGFTRLVVAAALTVGMFAPVLALWSPWLAEFRNRNSHGAQKVFWTSVIGIAAAFLTSVLVMTGAVDVAETGERGNALAAAGNKNIAEATAVQNHVFTLTLAKARVTQRIAAAIARREEVAVLKSLFSERNTIDGVLRLEFKREGDLFLDGVNLVREEEGKGPLEELLGPKEHPSKTKGQEKEGAG